MKVGFPLRRAIIKSEKVLKRAFQIGDYLFWALFDPSKFVAKPKKIKNVLVIDLGAYGDCLNTLSIIDSLQSHYKDINFHFLTSQRFEKEASGAGINLLGYSSAEQLHEYIKSKNFDMALIIHLGPVKPRDLKKIKFRVGSEVEGITPILHLEKFSLSRKIFPLYRHKIRERFAIFELAGFKFKNYELNLPLSKVHAKEAGDLVKNLKLRNFDRIVFLNPSAGTSNKARKKGLVPSHDWPLENFAQVAKQLARDSSTKILITGGKEDHGLASEIIKLAGRNPNIESICGKTSFFGLGALMQAVKDRGILITLDTGTAHLGACSGIKVIDLMGPYDPRLYCVWEPSSSLEESRAVTLFNPSTCANCGKYYCPENKNLCLESINPEDVLNLIKFQEFGKI